MSSSWCTPDKGEKGAVIGEIFFTPNGITLGAPEANALAGLIAVLATHQHAEVHGFHQPNLLLLGDAEETERSNPAKARASAVEQHIRSKLPDAAVKRIKLESAAKGAAALPGMKPPPGQARKRVVQIINKGTMLKAVPAPAKKAGSVGEALRVASQMFNANNKPAHPNARNRIKYWLDGPGRASVERGDDAYLVPTNPRVVRQAQTGTPELSDQELASLKKELPQIGPNLMSVAAQGNPSEPVLDMLASIDAQIVSGIDFIVKQKGVEASSFGSSGLDQLARFVFDRAQDKSSFYFAYLGGVQHEPEAVTPMGVWEVKAGKWTWRYELHLDQRAKWTDVDNKQTGTGTWVQNQDGVTFIWAGSANREVWTPTPLNPSGQKGVWIWADGTQHQILAVRKSKWL